MAADSGMDTCPSPENGDSRKRPLDGEIENGDSKRSHFSPGNDASEPLPPPRDAPCGARASRSDFDKCHFSRPVKAPPSFSGNCRLGRVSRVGRRSSVVEAMTVGGAADQLSAGSRRSLELRDESRPPTDPTETLYCFFRTLARAGHHVVRAEGASATYVPSSPQRQPRANPTLHRPLNDKQLRPVVPPRQSVVHVAYR